MSPSVALRRMKRSDITVHGFRSTFRDWCAESSNFPREVCEHALAHNLPDKVEAAYRRGDLLDKRIQLMKAWADYCTKPAAETPAATVTPIRSKRKTSHPTALRRSSDHHLATGGRQHLRRAGGFRDMAYFKFNTKDTPSFLYNSMPKTSRSTGISTVGNP